MTAPPAIDVALQRRRLVLMLAVELVCVVVAVGSLVGFVGFHIAWMALLFFAAAIVGFAGRLWLMLGVGRRS
jgi:hypothetical protein